MHPATHSESSLAKLEAVLASAARQHVAELRRAEEVGAQEAEARALLKRLGFSWKQIERIGAGPLDSALKEEVRTVLMEEMARLARQVRAGSPAYDINRHIVVRRVMARFFPPLPSAPKEPVRRPRRARAGRRALRGRPQ